MPFGVVDAVAPCGVVSQNQRMKYFLLAALALAVLAWTVPAAAQQPAQPRVGEKRVLVPDQSSEIVPGELYILGRYEDGMGGDDPGTPLVYHLPQGYVLRVDPYNGTYHAQ